jgi:hypothetical protein
MAKEAKGAAAPSKWPQRSARRPTSSKIAELIAGIAINSQAQVKKPVAGTGVTVSSGGIGCPLELQQIRVVD